MSKRYPVCTLIAATVTALTLPAFANPVVEEPPVPQASEVTSEVASPPAEAVPADSEASDPLLEPVGVAEPAPVDPTASGSVVAEPASDSVAVDAASGSLAVEQASGSVVAEPASGSVLVESASGSMAIEPASGSVTTTAASPSAVPVAGPSFSMPNMKLPFPLQLSYRPETGSMGGTGFAASSIGAPAQYNQPAQQTQAWAGTAEVGLGLLSVAGRFTNYGTPGMIDPATFAANSTNAPSSASVPYYWPESAWSTYVRMFGLRFGYLNEQFNRGINNGNADAIGSLMGGLDSGFNILGLVGVDYHALLGWGVHGQTVAGTTTSHVPAEAEASLYVNLGPVNLRTGYVARASFTGDPSTFLAIMTNPMSLATDTEKRNTVNQTRLGTYMGPFFGAGFTF